MTSLLPPLALSQLDLVALDSRRLAPARLLAAAVVVGLVALTLDLPRALGWGAAIFACEGLMWGATGAFARGKRASDRRRLAYMVSALCGCVSWLALSLIYWFDPRVGNAFLAQLIWSSLLLNAISFAFRSNLALVVFTLPVAATMLTAPILAPRFSGAQQLMAVVGLVILVSYALISARRNVRAAAELVETQRALERAKAAAEGANAAKTVFLATMSHEIRTPLNGVLGMAQAMAREPLPPRQQERLDVIRQGGEVLLALLNDILDLARIETGRLELEDGPVDLAELTRAVAAAFTPQATDKGLRLTLRIAPETEGLWRGDLIRLRQILFNLLSNAVKFTDVGGVTVALEREPDRSEPGAGVVLTVRDTGPGIPADRLPTLFDRFVQGAASTNRRFGGSGLGLAIVRELTELMGGRVQVRSASGEGSTFTVRLPLRAAEPAPQAAPPVEPPPSEARALRVLAAEDNPMNQLVLKTLLEPLGADMTFVEDGVQAVDAWADGAFDLILMDIQMPVMDGLAATRLIRQVEAADAGRGRIPIIALTANVMSHQQADYRAAGIDAVVPKPIQLAELVGAMGELLG